ILDAMGKYNIHRYMNLLGKLGLKHSVLMDSDNEEDIHGYLNDFIQNNRNEKTLNIDYFEDDLEAFLEIKKPNRRDLKPLNIMMKLHNGEIEEGKIDELKKKILGLIEDEN